MIKETSKRVPGFLHQWKGAWNQFWFVPAPATTLGIMRILVGSMILYSHLVWTLGLDSFFGSSGVLPDSYRAQLLGESHLAWSHFDWVGSPMLLMIIHWIGLFVVAMFTLGFATRITGILTAMLVISYANRATGAQFGLDQIMSFLALYLAIGNSGDAFSIDRKRLGNQVKDRVINNIALRLIQIHMCLVYLFAGLGKLQGTTWWNGEAMWGSFASYEYQTLDMTWLCEHMWLVNIITLIAVSWEVSYPFLVWHRLTRPIFLGIAVLVHLGIGMTMGMVTFGLIMIYGNISFLRPEWLGFLTREHTEH